MSSTTRTHDHAPANREAELATFGAVHLDVTDLDRSLGFWHDLIGLQLHRRDRGEASLGTDEDTLLVLHAGATSPGHVGGLTPYMAAPAASRSAALEPAAAGAAM